MMFRYTGHPRKPYRLATFAYVAVPVITLLLVLCGQGAAAQTQDTGKVLIDIRADVIQHNKTDTGEINRFIGNAVFRQGTDTLYCDSLYQNLTTNIIQAFSNVRIAQQGGTQGECDYLRYTPNTKDAFMQGNVSLTDGKNELWCEELTYNLGTKTAVYNKSGVLHSDSTTVSSTAGTYNVKSKDARFTGKVIVTDPRYHITSEDLGYNTETKVETFFAHSIVTSDSGKSVLVTDKGTYDSKNVIAHFTGHSSIWNDGQYIEADTMNYNKVTGYGFAFGNVITLDTAQHSTLYCGRAEYFRHQRVLWATIKPVLMQVNDKDTLYMRADTFYSAPMVKVSVAPGVKLNKFNDTLAREAAVAKQAADSAAMPSLIIPAAIPKINVDTIVKAKEEESVATELPKGKKKRGKAIASTDVPKAAVPVAKAPEKNFADSNIDWIVPAWKYRMPARGSDTARAKPVDRSIAGGYRAIDTAAADTTAPLFFVGYHHVLIFSDSLQGKCDSVVYTRADSNLRMIYNPIAWAHHSQITGDTIIMHLDSNHIKRMFVPNNALLVSLSGPEKAGMYDQIQGKTLTAYFDSNQINKMVVLPKSESIYYSKDDSGAYIGVNQAQSDKMRIFFADQKISRIKFEVDVHQTLTPMEEADIPNTKLSRFKWLIDLQPKSKEELFR